MAERVQRPVAGLRTSSPPLRRQRSDQGSITAARRIVTEEMAGHMARGSIRMGGVAGAIAAADAGAAAASTRRAHRQHRSRQRGRRKAGSMLRATADTFGDRKTATSPRAATPSSPHISRGKSDFDAGTPSRPPWAATGAAV
jgi:hypothetical protein